ncbi:hypothetical protein N7478_003325 [Penicillium angulare]|uniref:uncharacterized protein n=1 Tax=Penicillium angulare TaxID=116970 RepID=UPI0025412440|nr:uncharacterized protein N7478_003325 [Penicillium angulare]KAJ5287639.1 hypothetical protein N7478_003325 [Penicillium angulare]
MTTEGVSVQNPIPAPASTSEPSQPVQSVVHPSQTESELLSGENAKAGANVDSLEAPTTKPSVAPPTESSIGRAVASSEPEAPVDAQVQVSKAQTQGQIQNEETKEEPQTGEKRDLDSTTTPASVPTAASVTEDKKEPASEATEEPEAKKQKLDVNAAPASDANEPAESSPVAPATTTATQDTNGDSKKAGRPKKEKVKEAIKKVIPGDGIGSRTRSRTKAT